MRTRSWVILFCALFLLLAGLSALHRFGAQPAASAAVYVDGVLRQTIALSADGDYRIETAAGWNELRVRAGKLAVTAASCPDGDCVRCGERNSGPPIVCLPNRVSIRFTEQGELDGVVR